MKALVGAFNQEKALVGAFYVIVKTDCETDGSFYSTTSQGAQCLGLDGDRVSSVQVIRDCQHSVSIKHNLRVATQTQEAASTPHLQRQQSWPVQELFGDTVSCLRQLQTHFPDTNNKIQREGIIYFDLYQSCLVLALTPKLFPI